MYETIRIVGKLKPKYVIWENVKNILSKRHKHNFDAYLKSMEQLGYKNFYKVMNAKDHGVAQNRDRIFTVSILNGGIFTFPEKIDLEIFLKDILEDNVDEKYYLNDKQISSLVKSTYKQNKRVYSLYGIAPTLTTMGGGQREPKIAIKTANKKGYDIATDGDGIDLAHPNSSTRRGRVGHGVAKTISTEITQGVLDGTRIRKLTPRECWRLMGFSDDDFDKVKGINSNTQLYNQAGNSICVPVLQRILENLLDGEDT